MRVITFGTYDLFHYGHLEILKRAKECGDFLIVGVSSDELNFSKKSHNPVISLEMRMEIIKSIRYVDTVFIEHRLEDKVKYCIDHRADLLIMGDDHVGRFDFVELETEGKTKVIYLHRTENVSTTCIINKIKK